MNPNDKEVARAIRQYAALQEALAARKCKPSPNFVEQVLAQIRSDQTDRRIQDGESTPIQTSWTGWFRATWRPFAVGGAALAAILMFVVVQGYLNAGNSYAGQTDPSELRGTINLLPLRLNVDFKTTKIVLRGSGIELSGSVTPLVSESSSGTNVYQLDVSGKDSDGKICTIANGRAHFILKTPGGVIKNKGDTTEVRLEGRLEVAGQGSYAVRRTYIP